VHGRTTASVRMSIDYVKALLNQNDRQARRGTRSAPASMAEVERLFRIVKPKLLTLSSLARIWACLPLARQTCWTVSQNLNENPGMKAEADAAAYSLTPILGAQADVW
jgi:hypothetical protein